MLKKQKKQQHEHVRIQAARFNLILYYCYTQLTTTPRNPHSKCIFHHNIPCSMCSLFFFCFIFCSCFVAVFSVFVCLGFFFYYIRLYKYFMRVVRWHQTIPNTSRNTYKKTQAEEKNGCVEISNCSRRMHVERAANSIKTVNNNSNKRKNVVQ